MNYTFCHINGIMYPDSLDIFRYDQDSMKSIIVTFVSCEISLFFLDSVAKQASLFEHYLVKRVVVL